MLKAPDAFNVTPTANWNLYADADGNLCVASGNYCALVGEDFTGFSKFAPTGGDVPLPIELVHLKAYGVDNEFIRLDWMTAVEIDNAGFEMYRSMDGRNFERIGWVDGHGNTSETQQYCFDDEDVSTNQLYYYYLNQIDFDGTNEETYQVAAQLLGDDEFYLSEFMPNPTKGKSRVEIAFGGEDELLIRLINNLGSQIIEQVLWLEEGKNSIDFNFEGLMKGSYYASFTIG